MALAKHIFKAYDIRGLADLELSEDLSYRIGRAYVAYLRDQGIVLDGKKLVVGRDMRPTSPAFAASVIEGIRSEGIAVVDIGQASTPLFNFTCSNYPEFAGGIMVTASHNPAEYNGFKMTLGNALPVPGKAMLKWVEAVSGEATLSAPLATFDPLPDYLQKIFSLVPAATIKPLKVVIDFGNGMGIVTFRKLLENLPQVDATLLFPEPDGTFPNHEANPLKTDTLETLQKKVLETGADFGFALDGDCDRIGLVDERGTVVEASFVGALLGVEVLATHPKATMLYDLRSSMIVPESWLSRGATTAMSMVGHANIKKQMLEVGATFASELSLHLYFGDLHNIEASDLCLLYVLKLLSERGEKLSEIVAPFKKYFHSGEINFEVETKDAVMQKLEEQYQSSALEISHLDGLWMKFDWGWLSVRASNTEPVLRLNLEATTKETMESKVLEFTKLIEHK